MLSHSIRDKAKSRVSCQLLEVTLAIRVGAQRRILDESPPPRATL